MKIAAILTGKENSTFKKKNLKKINKKYIFYFPCIEARKVKSIKRFYTSSDSNLILRKTKKLGFVSINRPKYLATKKSKHIDVLKHSINFMKKENFYPDVLLVLLANAPIVKKEWIIDCINILKRNKKATAVVPVKVNNDNHPLRAKKIYNGYLTNFMQNKNNVSSNRQDLENCYFLCHNFWLIRTKEIEKNIGHSPWNFMGKKVIPYKIKNSVDIHNRLDLDIVRLLINNDKKYL